MKLSNLEKDNIISILESTIYYLQKESEDYIDFALKRAVAEYNIKNEHKYDEIELMGLLSIDQRDFNHYVYHNYPNYIDALTPDKPYWIGTGYTKIRIAYLEQTIKDIRKFY